MNTEQQLRTLLDAYYDGTSSPDDIATIQRLFDELTDIPSDLSADRDIFQIIADPDLDNVACPPRLETLIDEKVKELDSNRTPRALWINIASIAAAIAIIFTIGIIYLTSPKLDSPKTEGHIAAAETDTILSPVIAEEMLASSAAQPESTETHASETNRVDPDNNHPVKIQAKPASTSDIREVTDPAEAKEQTLLALNCLSDNLGKARKATRMTDETLLEINNKIQNILK